MLHYTDTGQSRLKKSSRGAASHRFDTMTAALPQSPVAAEETNLVRKIGFYSLLAFVYFFNSGVADFGHIYFLHLPLIFGLSAGLSALLAGTLLPPFQTRVGVCYIALTFWFTLGLPFSFWRGGSV